MTARLRQVVLATDDLAAAATAARDCFGQLPGVADAEGMRTFDLEHEVLVLGTAYLEIVAPLGNRPELPGARFLASGGPGGYMLDIQVPNLDETVRRAGALGLRPVLHAGYRGNVISQWHPRDVGTLLEIDEIRGGRDWHWDDEIPPEQRARERARPVGAELVVAEPECMAERWATIFDGDMTDSCAVRLTDATVTFRMGTRRPGLMSIDMLVPADTSDGDVEIAGVLFRRQH